MNKLEEELHSHHLKVITAQKVAITGNISDEAFQMECLQSCRGVGKYRSHVKKKKRSHVKKKNSVPYTVYVPIIVNVPAYMLNTLNTLNTVRICIQLYVLLCTCILHLENKHMRWGEIKSPVVPRVCVCPLLEIIQIPKMAERNRIYLQNSTHSSFNTTQNSIRLFSSENCTLFLEIITSIYIMDFLGLNFIISYEWFELFIWIIHNWFTIKSVQYNGQIIK